MWEKYYRIGDHDIVIKGVTPIGNYAFPKGFDPFEGKGIESKIPLFTLDAGMRLVADNTPANYNFLFEELNLTCEFVAEKDNFEFRMIPNTYINNPKTGNGIKSLLNYPIILRMPRRDLSYNTNLLPSEDLLSEFSFLLWNAYGVASASHKTVAMHSSVIIHKGKAVLFLGETGTGKSTHTQLWLGTIKGSELLNDDSPIVRIINNIPVCYGSPWSGKGRCYRNESYPIAAIVRLRPSLMNSIKKLNHVEAFQALYPSCPPSFTADTELTDHVCNTLSEVIKNVPIYLLDCRPDTDAALLSFTTIFGHHDINSIVGHE